MILPGFLLDSSVKTDSDPFRGKGGPAKILKMGNKPIFLQFLLKNVHIKSIYNIFFKVLVTLQNVSTTKITKRLSLAAAPSVGKCQVAVPSFSYLTFQNA